MPRCTALVLHSVLLAVWIVLVIPTVLLWSESILWIGFMSIYAIIGIHAGAIEAALAKRAVQDGGGDTAGDREP